MYEEKRGLIELELDGGAEIETDLINIAGRRIIRIRCETSKIVCHPGADDTLQGPSEGDNE